MPLFSSYKTTLKQELNGEKWDVGHLSAFGWAISVRCFGVQCWEEFCCNNSARIILNHASVISYAQPWWVSSVCRTCVDCSPGAGTHPWSKSSWTAASCWCWAPPCPWCPKCWVSVWLLACLSLCLSSLSVPTVVWSDYFCTTALPVVFKMLGQCLSVFSLRPHCCLVRLFLCTAALLLLACFPQSNSLKNAMQMWWIISLSSPHVWLVSHLTCWLVWSAMSVGLTGYMSVCPACLPDLSCWSVWPVILFCLTCPVMSVWHVWPVVLFLTCHVMPVWCVWPVMLICLTCRIISVWYVWPVMLICEMSYKLDLPCVCLICHVGPSDRYIQAVMLICLNCHVCQCDLSRWSVWLASGQSHSPLQFPPCWSLSVVSDIMAMSPMRLCRMQAHISVVESESVNGAADTSDLDLDWSCLMKVLKSSTFLQTPGCSEYHPSKQSPVVSAPSVSRLQPSGTNALFLSVTLPLSVLFNLP